MRSNLWSDEDRLLIPRTLGWSMNFKYIAKKFGWVKSSPAIAKSVDADIDTRESHTAKDRLRQSVERSRFEDR